MIGVHVNTCRTLEIVNCGWSAVCGVRIGIAAVMVDAGLRAVSAARVLRTIRKLCFMGSQHRRIYIYRVLP